MTSNDQAKPLVADANAPWYGGEVFLREDGGNSGTHSSQLLGYCKPVMKGRTKVYMCAATHYEAQNNINATEYAAIPDGYLELYGV